MSRYFYITFSYREGRIRGKYSLLHNTNKKPFFGGNEIYWKAKKQLMDNKIYPDEIFLENFIEMSKEDYNYFKKGK